MFPRDQQSGRVYPSTGGDVTDLDEVFLGLWKYHEISWRYLWFASCTLCFLVLLKITNYLGLVACLKIEVQHSNTEIYECFKLVKTRWITTASTATFLNWWRYYLKLCFFMFRFISVQFGEEYPVVQESKMFLFKYHQTHPKVIWLGTSSCELPRKRRILLEQRRKPRVFHNS